jgi:hypothetical protein
VSLIKTDPTANGTATIGSRTKDVVVLVVPMGKRAGTTVVQGVRQGVQGAREWATPRLEEAVYSARTWAAPRLEDAADAVDTSVAPAVSSALRSTAQQVRPYEVTSGKTGLRRLLDWRWLLGVGLVAAAAGTAAAAAVKRYASATAEAKDATESPDEERPPADESPPGDSAARSEDNGQVTAPKR